MSEWYKELGITDPFFADDNVCIIHGDCREVLSSNKKCGSAIVTDPPYELGFMGKSWDSKGVSFQKETWEIIRSVCLPGAPLLSFGGSRTQHHIACAIEDAGWGIRDTLMWVYGSGFPKSLDISKAIDKMKGVKREVVGSKVGLPGYSLKHQGIGGILAGREDGSLDNSEGECAITAPATDEAQLWNGYGTALKPAYEPIILARNPLDKTFANNALKYGISGLNIDECRIVGANGDGHWTHKREIGDGNIYHSGGREELDFGNQNPSQKGRFPANFLHDGSDEVLELFPETKSGNTIGKAKEDVTTARFFYCAKASKSERGADNNHPTVKPLALMEYLCKLVKMPEYNLILDPFMGSGTTLLACTKLGIPCIGIDSDEQSCETAAIRYLRSLAE